MALAVAAKVRGRVVVQRRFPFVRVALKRNCVPVRCPAQASRGAQQGGLSVEPSQYPPVARQDVVERLHSVDVPDPYRWLEDPSAEATKEFVAAQNAVTDSVLARCDARADLKDLISRVMDHPKRGVPFKRGPRWYYYYNPGLANQFVMYSSDAPDADGIVFFDPNTLSDDGTVSLGTVAFSPDGSVMAYALSSGGSDWTEVKALRVAADGTTQPLTDHLRHVKFSGLTWTLDGKGFFYNRYDQPEVVAGELGTETDTNVNQKLYYHVLGTAQAEDVRLFEMPEHPTWMSGAQVTDDGRWLILSISEGCEPANRLYACDLAALPRNAATGAIDFARFACAADGAPRLGLIKLVDAFEASFSVIASEGSVLTLLTNYRAPRYRLVTVDALGGVGMPKFTEIVAQHPKDLLQGAKALKGDIMVVEWMRDVQDVLEVRRLSDGALLGPFPLPMIGTLGGLSSEPRRASDELFFSLTSFVEPGAIYRARVTPDSPPHCQLFHRTKLAIEHDPADYETSQVFVRSKDGTRVPMFVVHRKGRALDGTAPTLLYGYGGFSVSLQPTFSASRLAWLKAFDGVFALANLRGGGEYGRAWRDDGSKLRKQNVFDDFHAAAERLIADGYASPATLTIQGGSNGGLLVAAAANQRPDLYGAVLAQVGVMDMLRFHKFTIGHAWCTDYGSPDDPAMFDYLRSYSPLHNVRPPADGGQYPAMLLTTGDHDDRVVPLHSLKLLAQLQYALVHDAPATTQRNPLLGRIEVRAGHGAGKPTAKVIEEVADMFAFAAAATGAKMRAITDKAGASSVQAASS